MPEIPSHTRTSNRDPSCLPRPDYVFRSRQAGARDRQVREAQLRIDDQRARLQRMTARGSVTQSDDDLLRKLCDTLRQIREQ
jgi:hypothetical protein